MTAIFRQGRFFFYALLSMAFLMPMPAHAAGIDGAQLSAFWIIPFVCMLLSIAVFPLVMPSFWHHHFGKIATGWGLAFLLPFAIKAGFSITFYEFLHAMLTEYLPFIIVLFSLYTVAGGIRLKGSLAGTPLVNTGILVAGTLLASWMGTTGAAMLLIRPLLRANAHRRYQVHSVVFFIFLVANIGGSLTPLGDPPLFLGFLKGVPFFWTLTHLFMPMLFVSSILLILYFVVDTFLYAKEGKPSPKESSNKKFGLEGKVNLILLAGVVASVLLSGVWQSKTVISLHGVGMRLPDIVRDVLLLSLAALSLRFTAKQTRKLNGFTWAPIAEVAKLFFGIFTSMIPAIAILRAGDKGALSAVIQLVSQDGAPVNSMYFWLTGMLSGFLDNAPTYLVFFNTAGGDPLHLTTDMAQTLIAISTGAVFMGAITYIGNAPNFMVRSIAESQGVRMPSFFGYIVWSAGILLPVFILFSLIFF